MKEYKVTITETLTTDVFVEAESQLEAEQMVSDAWRNSEYILDAENFAGVEFTAEDTVPKHEMSWSDMCSLFSRVNTASLTPVTGYIVFTADSFITEYNEESRTYSFSSFNKAFIPSMGGFSIFANCLDGTDKNIRIDRYINGESAWKIEKCYVVKDEYDKLMKELAPAAVVKPNTIAR